MEKKKKTIRQVSAVALAGAIMVGATTMTASAKAQFADVPESMWCYQSVNEAVNNGFMNGYGNGKFGPSDAVTRSQICQILFNKYGEDKGAASGFKDVAENAWYAPAVTWASQAAIVSGFGNGDFGPAKEMTREQLVTILYNQAGKPEVQGNLEKYSDKNAVSDWAKDAFIWAIEKGIVSGTSETTLSPKMVASRAQVSVVMMRYQESLNGGNTVKPTEPDTKPTEPEKPVTPETPVTPDKPATPDSGKLAPEVESVYKAQSEEAQYYLNKVGMTVLTSADAVNKALGGGNKSEKYPTLGLNIPANKNGYHTHCTLDLSGCVLDYDALDYYNKLRNDPKVGVPRGNAKWTPSDAAEEQVMAVAKYHNYTTDLTCAPVVQANSAEEAIDKMWEADMLSGFIGVNTIYFAMAHYTEGGKTYYSLVGDDAGVGATGLIHLSERNYDIDF